MEQQPMDYIQVTLLDDGWDYLLTSGDEHVLNFALRFAQLIVNRDYATAFLLLSKSCKRLWPKQKLEEAYNVMIQDMINPVLDPCPITYMTQWHYMRHHQIGWVYIPITENGMVEAITMVVAVDRGKPPDEAIETSGTIMTASGITKFEQDPPYNFCVDELEFGRP